MADNFYFDNSRLVVNGQNPPTNTVGDFGQLSDTFKYNYSYKNQSLKNNNPKLRMTLQITTDSQTIKFQAHLDPNHFTSTQQKRFAKIDTLQGVVVQDFGYRAELINLKGTTGLAYYQEIQTLDQIFNSQSNNNKPNSITLTIEQRTYIVAWENFSFDRQNTGGGPANLINYEMDFIVLNRGAGQSETPTPSTVVAGNGVNGNQGTQQPNVPIKQTSIIGSLNTYVASQSDSIQPQQQQAAINWIIQNNPNVAEQYNIPTFTKYTPLNNVQITVPLNWNTVLSQS
jgi:hypothetical protein